MQTYVAFLRGINVGGNGLIKMAALQECLSVRGFANVRTYIQSGNVVFDSDITDTDALAASISKSVNETFNLKVGVAVIEAKEWRGIIESAPSWWGKNPAWKHNLLIMVTPCDTNGIVEAIGVLKPEIESVKAGHRVVYQSVSLPDFGRAASGKLASLPIYKMMTVRNYNTATKIANLLG